METVSSKMLKIFEKCDICLDEHVFSKELLMKTFAEFLSKTVEKDEHNISVVMHTGSVCFDAMMFAYAAVSNIFYNGSDAQETVKMLIPGDMVLYYQGKTKVRCRFLGFVNSPDEAPGREGKTAVLEQEKKLLRHYVPQVRWANIVPYYGKSTSTDGRGLRRENENKRAFFVNVLGIDPSEIPRSIDTSSVVIISREYADRIINGLSFKSTGVSVKLTELVTASYFTDEDQEYPYAGNDAKSEPVIKITSRISVARKLLLRRGGNRNIGLIVIGDDLLRRGETELHDLVGRKSIQYVYVCSQLDSEAAGRLLLSEESAKLFACTKDFLLSYALPPVVNNPLTETLSRQADAIIEKSIDAIDVNSDLNWENYKQFKEAIYLIKSSDYDSKDKEAFIIQASSLMNLFLTAVFPMSLLNKLVETEIVANTTKPEDRLGQIKQNVVTFPNYLQCEAERAIQILERIYSKLESRNPKDFALRRVLAGKKDKKIAVIVPKAYFAAVMDSMGLVDNEQANITVVTANKFDNRELYDVIICVGYFEGSKFNIFRCRSAQYIYVLLYESEKMFYKRSSVRIGKAEREYVRRSIMEYETETDEYEQEDNIEGEANEVDRIDSELKEYINGAAVRAYGSYIGGISGGKNMTAEIVSIATFDTEEVAFFSKNYRAYVLDEEAQTVKEVKASELSEGDTIVFTRSSAKTRDVVDGLLQKMLDEKRVPENMEVAYRRSRIWKTRLINYMNETGEEAGAIANRMIRNGVSVQEPTIRGWLDEDSHTVGPRKLESIQQIALLTNDEEMFDQAETIFKACADVRRIRGKIMDAIGRAVLSGITGGKHSSDPIFDLVYSQIGELSVMLQIESISFVKENVPINIINRPITVD